MPEHLLSRPDIRDAVADLDWATVLTATLRETGVSQAALADATGMSQQQVSRLVSGDRQARTIDTVKTLCDGLGIPRALAGLAPGPEEDTTERRDFITSIGAAAAITLAPSDTTARMTPASAEREVRRLREAIPHLWAGHNAHGGTQKLCKQATDLVRRADALVENGLPNPRLESQAQGVASGLGMAAGWLYYDAERHADTKSHWQYALYTAQLSGDLLQEVYALESLSAQASYTGRPREGQRLAVRAQKMASGWATPRLTALLHMREATAWAGQKNLTEFRKAVSRARHEYGTVKQADPMWIDFFIPAELDGLEGLGYVRAGAPKRAPDLIRRALGELGPNLRRNQTYYTACLGQAIAETGDVTGAAEILTPHLPALAAGGSRRARQRVASVVARARTTKTSAARAFVDAATVARAA